ncbi:T9SS type A sorting domain-containing protein [bacterium]|nr:T9SS type A sorting domain-containing protein [bacterium]
MKRSTIILILIMNAALAAGAFAVDEFKITADDAEAGDQFGISVSIDGDYAIIGAYLNDDNGNNSGSAYIFVRDGEEWTQQQKLTADDAEMGDVFGFSVSISGDYAIIGAYRSDDGGNMSGSAYIFSRDGNEWTQQAKLTANDADTCNYFGYSVFIAGDYAIAGAAGNDENGNLSGSAYIFVRDGNEWTQQQKLTADDGEARDQFGWSVSINGDYVIIGAPWSDDAGDGSGSAYVFVCDGDEWTQQQKLTADDAEADEEFGYSVSIDANYVIIGARTDDDNGWESGSAYIFVRDGDEWTQQQKLIAADTAADDYFGMFVSNSGDYTIISAPKNNDDGDDSGSIYLFVRDDDEWIEKQKLTASDAASNDWFGSFVSLNGDHVIVGARYNDDNGENYGSAYIYSLACKIDVSSVELDFGEIPVDSSRELTITIYNKGILDLTVSDISVVGDYFSNDFEDETVIDNEDSLVVTVTFTPEEIGEYSGSLTITSNDIVNDSLTVALIGIGPDAVGNDTHNTIPTEFSLSQPYPNPFNSTTQLSFDLPMTSNVSLQVFDLKGQLICTLVNGKKSAGSYTVIWNGQDAPAGIYLARMETDAFSAVRKMVLVR